MLETNKQVLVFKFGEDLSYFVILWYKLDDFIKIYDDYVNGPKKAVLLFQTGRKGLEYKWLWLHTKRKSLLGLSFMIDNQTI